MEGLGALIIGIAVTVGLIVWLVRAVSRVGRDLRADTPSEQAGVDFGHDEAPPAEAPPAEAPSAEADELWVVARVNKLAGQAGEAFDDSDHPSEMLGVNAFNDAVELMAEPDNFSPEALVAYLGGHNMLFACMAGAALQKHEDGARVWRSVLDALPRLGGWQYYFLLPFLATAAPPSERLIGQVLVIMAANLGYQINRGILAEFIRARHDAGEVPSLGDEAASLPTEYIDTVKGFLESLDPELAAPLLEQIDTVKSEHVDTSYLEQVGTLWDQARRDLAANMIAHPALDAAYNELIGFVHVQPPRSILLVGESGVGKTATLEAICQGLYDQGWTIFEAGHAEIIAGQVYIGELEERLQRLLRDLSAGKRIVWRIPDLPNLVYAGVHKFSPVSALDTILPAIAEGELLVVAEADQQAWEQLSLSRPRVASAFAVQRLMPLPEDQAKALAGEWLKMWTTPKGDTKTFLDETWELARQYLGDRAAPGNILGLLNLTIEQIEAEERGDAPTLVLDDLYVALAKMTGLPQTLLDDRKRLDLPGLRALFERQVKGQGEAVDALVERVALLKAGLTDPTRPAGVFLFAGPTGTGKTEIAKALAEWLFGSAGRLVRLDMSELQTPESLDRILGAYEGGAGALVDEIREHPFSVILLDEFEKAHSRIWDLFLQVFDDGRLTDRRGRTADFRHAIIILTSNLGAVIPTGVSLGFHQDSPGFDTGAVHKAVAEAFRKEFVNRLDRVVVFRPLSRDTMREILEKELHAVLRRRGIRSKEWAVEWDESAIDFLLAKGGSPATSGRGR